MARTVKKELSIEEKLAEALVPEGEQPYRVPGNWCWVRLGKLYHINPKNEATDDMEAAFVPMEKISAGMSQSFDYDVQPWGKAKKGHTQFADGDVAFAKISPCFENRKSMIVNGLPNGIGGGTTELIILRQPIMNQHFTYWLVNSEEFIQRGSLTYSGTVGQQRISMDYVRNYPVPVPPLPEQQRIVTLIESLFADLDEAKEKLPAVLEGFAQRKAAILHRAFTGELTAKWREEHGILEKRQVTKRFDEVAVIKSNLVDPADYQDYPHIAPDNIEKKTGRLLEYNTVANDKVKSGKHRFYKGQILYSKIRPYLSKVVLIDFDGLCSADMYPIESSDNVDIRYLWYYMLSDDFLIQASTAGSRSVLPKINQKELSSLSVVVTDVAEQREIVRILDDIFSQEQQAQSAVESVLSDIDTLKKSILARAFRGELSTGDPGEESAVEMLKRVL